MQNCKTTHQNILKQNAKTQNIEHTEMGKNKNKKTTTNDNTNKNKKQ